MTDHHLARAFALRSANGNFFTGVYTTSGIPITSRDLADAELYRSAADAAHERDHDWPGSYPTVRVVAIDMTVHDLPQGNT